MRPLKLVPSHRAARRGRLDAKLLPADGLHLPKAYAEALGRIGIGDAYSLVDHMRGFPKAIASALGWTEPEVTVALVQLVSQLEGVVDNAYLHPPERQQRVYGSFNPMEYKLGGAKGH